jgi:lipocalin
VTSKKMLRGLWIAVAGAGLALGAGSGVAAAESDASDAGPGPSTTESSQMSQTAAETTPVGTKDVDKDHASGDGAAEADKPTSTVSAATVTVRRHDTDTAEPVDQVTPAAVTSTKHSKPAAKAEDISPEPVATEETDKSVEPTPKASTLPAEVVPIVTESVVEADPAPVAEVAQITAARSLAPTASTFAAPGIVRPTPGPIATIFISLLSPFGLLPPLPPVPANVVGVPADPLPGTSLINGVTGVKVGSSSLAIPVGDSTYTGAADWYFPTQADGTVQAQGVTLLQHGFLGSNFWYSALATDVAQRTNSIVVVPNIPSFGFFTCAGCTLSAVPMQQGVAALFIDPSRTSLTASALAAGYHGVLPDKFVLTGHSAGGGLATAAGGFYVDAVAPATNDLLGVVMYDGVSSNGTFSTALSSLDALDIPVYQIAAPPQAWNANGQTTADLVTLRPGQFVGDTLVDGSHVDSLIGGSPLIDFVSQLVIRRSPPGNTQGVYTLADGWINDMYAGLGPNNGVYGTYGDPDQYIVLGQAAAVVLGPPPVVDVNKYLGTWYEVGSVRQFFSIGLVNTTAVYTDNGDGTIGVENSGNYFFDSGPESRIFGTAVPLNAENNKLDVTFFGPPSASPPGNYWIVDLASDYSWAIVSDPNGLTGFLLSRTRTVPDALYQELLGRASVKGVKRWIIPTRQPAAALNTVTV